ncbi:hypothetical protein [Arthrobacter sp. GMC3]|uniref:hypothetical protein n=1 Tax=Arthrobacter sp. GMC3 TaxID=2058894 RepID=UPI000CE3D780|nr:hypothetical protein [Arthrobacter sp. GMC3]
MQVVEGRGAALNGLDLLGVDESGVTWRVENLDDLLSPSGSTGEVIQNAFGDGGWAGQAYREPRPIRLLGWISGDSRDVALAAATLLASKLPYKSFERLSMSDLGEVSHLLVRVAGKPFIKELSSTYFTFDIQLIAPDPRKLGGDGSTPYQFSATAFLPSTSGGLQLPVTAPFSIGATVVNGSVTVTATGDAPPPVMVRINGPIVGPVIRDRDGNSMPLDISLDVGQWLDVDFDAHTIKLNSTVSRRNALRGRWITASAGMVLSLDADVYNPLANMTVFWTDASY